MHVPAALDPAYVSDVRPIYLIWVGVEVVVTHRLKFAEHLVDFRLRADEGVQGLVVVLGGFGHLRSRG